MKFKDLKVGKRFIRVDDSSGSKELLKKIADRPLMVSFPYGENKYTNTTAINTITDWSTFMKVDDDEEVIELV